MIKYDFSTMETFKDRRLKYIAQEYSYSPLQIIMSVAQKQKYELVVKKIIHTLW